MGEERRMKAKNAGIVPLRAFALLHV